MDIFNKICRELSLGEITSPPKQLTGGFMHKMYSLFTTSGKFAVKLLNPYVMKRDTVFENYRTAEELEAKLEQNNIPILPALVFNGRKMQKIDGQYFYLFDFYEGRALKSREIRVRHCKAIGGLLAKIHAIDKKTAPYERSEIHIDWDFYIDKLAFENQELYDLLNSHRALLYETQEKGNEAIKKIPDIIAICHNDMDSKNVLWNGNDCRIIDLECLTFASPFVELYEMALCWSGYEHCNIDFEKFNALIRSYAQSFGELPNDWKTVYYSSYGRLEWLEYNVKRALGIDCSADEKKTGISEVKDTMAHIIYYHNAKDDILGNLMNI